MRRFGLAAAMLLVGCERTAEPPPPLPSAGQKLEQAALAAGLVSDSARVEVSGVFQSEGDLVCLLPPRADGGDEHVIGISVDYGEGQRCVARGTAEGRTTLALDLGEGCRFDARLDADRLVLPGQVPSGCSSACSGRATLAAVAVERLSSAAAEAARTRGADGALLCAS